MTDTIQRAFAEQLHPRGTGAVGGQFVAAGGAAKAPPPTAKAGAGKRKPTGGGGNLSFDGKRGAGYGKKGGDPRVHKLQDALNRLGFTDGSGKKLAGDGKLGPRTTAAIKKAQRAMGLKADGVVTPALLAKLSGAKSAKDLKAKPKKAAPARKAAAPSKGFTKQKDAPVTKKATPVVVKRSVLGYSGRMTSVERHLPGKHNQQAHANRLGKPTNVGGKTGLGKATAALADKPELGPAAAPAVPERRKITNAEVLDILKDGDRPTYMGLSRKTEDHLRILEEAGVNPDQAKEIIKDLGGNPDRPWETKDIGYSLQANADREMQDAAAASRKERLALATPAAFARLLGTDGKPAMVKSKPVAKVFESMQANGWKMTAAAAESGSYTFSSPDGGKEIKVIAFNSVTIYDDRHNKISGVKALAYVEGR